jgi:hypothetical protein
MMSWLATELLVALYFASFRGLLLEPGHVQATARMEKSELVGAGSQNQSARSLADPPKGVDRLIRRHGARLDLLSEVVQLSIHRKSTMYGRLYIIRFTFAFYVWYTVPQNRARPQAGLGTLEEVKR